VLEGGRAIPAPLEDAGVPVTGRGPGAAGAPPVAGLLGIIGGFGTADATGAIGFATGVDPGVPNRDMNSSSKILNYFLLA
jgi:hypothetical protein